ncbi:rod shape-determining protein MreC [Desulfurispirillum indicum]|uniref:Cell shape-determining protein MreC n=1 Tax=Desulfurispirillum indicum (strain ATCC BAA-1389 / DSM 22839 / S5) TaxID=653733 RepID=E6W4W6_DESIS|nr:rod shape-determining protein MreC [Desulfurispirillum indicum]ADU64844.1 rod shape-determining protein MreC [Desulfurispirillum indicum S5]UCZ56776.1 rod shape-determining protein MreC [Desulfurispirillum indicum]
MLQFLFAKKKRIYFSLISLFLLVLIALQLSGKLHPANPINVILMPVTGPVQSFFVKNYYNLQDFRARYIDLREVEERNRQLSRELDDARIALLGFHEVQRELMELRRHLEYTRQNRHEYLYARVIGRNPSSWLRTITLDVGVEKGIKVNMPVVTPEGIVGRVVHVSLGYSQVLSVLDPKFAVSSVTSADREPLVAVGGYGSEMNIRYLDAGGKAREGDIVFTSGVDQVFPAGLPVGRITGIAADTDLFFKGTIAPFVDINRLEEVLVLKVEAGEFDAHKEEAKVVP